MEGLVEFLALFALAAALKAVVAILLPAAVLDDQPGPEGGEASREDGPAFPDPFLPG